MRRAVKWCFIVVCVFVVLHFGGAIADDQGTCGYGLDWILKDDGTLIISGTGNMYDYFSDNVPWGEKPTSVIIKDGAYNIGRSAFYNCSNLKSIILPESITSIESGAFYGCSSLKSITIPYGVISIGGSAFYECSGLKSITIPDSVKSIGGYALYGCNNLKSINISSNLTSIANNVFDGCKSLTSIIIPDSVTSIGNSAFAGCNKLSNIILSNGVTEIGRYAFNGCNSLTEIALPQSLTRIGERAFIACSGLTSITLPKNVISIGDWAFQLCYNLKNVAFELTESSVNVSYASNIFAGLLSNLTIYGYEFSAVDSWASQNGITLIYLDEIDIEDIRTISLRSESFTVAVGENQKIVPYIFPDDGSDIVWSSDNSDVIVVTNGVLTAVSTGTATITATIGTVTSSVTIDTYIPVTGFELNMKEAWVIAKEQLQLSVESYVPGNASATITWESSDPDRVMVDENGLITTIIPGDAVITATTERGIMRECMVHSCYPVTAIEFISSQEIVNIGSDFQLTANVTARTQNCVNNLITFASSNESIATVDVKTGLVHGIKTGATTVSATSASGITATVEILVLNKSNLLRLPEGLEEIADEAFVGINTQAIIIPMGCVSIGTRAFANCKGLQYVYIPATVSNIADDAFEGCEQVVIDRRQ